MLPDLKTAKQLFEKAAAVTDKLNLEMGLAEGDSRRHWLNVAANAEQIAAACGLNPQKAYILGLLHDYGEYIEDTVPGTFHGTAGYDEMMKLGYDEVARICLTHSFWEGIYDPDYFVYDKKEIARAGVLIASVSLDDYDRLIQLSDMLSDGSDIVRVDKRVESIIRRYRLNPDQAAFKKERAAGLKQYFDRKCGRDVYQLLGI